MSASRIAPDAKVMLKHGAGGRAMRELIQQVFVGDAKAPADGGDRTCRDGRRRGDPRGR